ncbi:hypothetical protein [Nonomuraea harbinensis]|uniref:hypothetical protein n=1 Tax=Nonomuraea harbinensis TaxID=1286938 RepID=UPI0036725E9C
MRRIHDQQGLWSTTVSHPDPFGSKRLPVSLIMSDHFNHVKISLGRYTIVIDRQGQDWRRISA